MVRDREEKALIPLIEIPQSHINTNNNKPNKQIWDTCETHPFSALFSAAPTGECAALAGPTTHLISHGR